MIRQFKDEYRFLSNFWRCRIEMDGSIYPTVEHAFQAAKTDTESLRSKMAQMTTREVKKFGRTLTLNEAQWEENRVSIMMFLVKQKFSLNKDLAQKLIATGKEELQEGNTWGDTFWGVDLKSGKGQNQLGIILMLVRDLIKNKEKKNEETKSRNNP
jgi:ribA/ribD-fused uncharacterized protein